MNIQVIVTGNQTTREYHLDTECYHQLDQQSLSLVTMDTRGISSEDAFILRSHCSLRLILKIICTLGCLCHFIVINSYYFKYETAAFYAPYIALRQQIPLLSLCFISSHSTATNITFMDQSNLVDISFDSSTFPSVNVSSVVIDCHMRNFSTGKMDFNSDCSVFFDVNQSRRDRYCMCYTLIVKNQLNFSSLQPASAMVDKFILYRLSLRDDLVNMKRMIFFNHLDPWPHQTPLYLMEFDATSERRKSSSFLLVHELIQYKGLPAPYDTKCIQSRPIACRVDSSHPLCSRNLCHQYLTVTDIEQQTRMNRGIDLAVGSEGAPVQLVKFFPKSSATAFFIQACSILGLWCSLSVASLVVSSIKFYREKRHLDSPELMKKWYDELINISRAARIDFTAIKLAVNRNICHRKTNQNTPRRLMKTILKIIILILFLREFTLLSIDYFKYKTRMEIHLTYDHALTVPGMSYCFNMDKWLNLKKPDHRLSLFNETMTAYSNKLNFTVKQILESTVDINSAIKSCRIRSSLTSSLEKRNDCLYHFDVTKFYFNEMICYNFNPRVNYQLKINIFRANDSHPSLLYSIIPEDSLSYANPIQPIISLDLPTESRFLASRLYRQYPHELIISSFIVYEYTNLPIPYDTMCDTTYNSNNCNIRCLNFSRINLTPYSELHSLPINLRPINYNDLKNESLAYFIKNMETKCTSMCRGSCHDSFTKTLQYQGYSSNERLELALAVPKYPFYQFDAIALFTLYTFLYQLACCASFWVGFSLVSILTFLVKNNKKHKIPHLSIYLTKVTQQLEMFLTKRYKRINGSTNSPKKQYIFKLKRTLLPCLLVLGFCAHSFTTVADYFRYQIEVDTRLELQTHSNEFMVTICISFYQLNLQGNYSVENIFMRSPRTEDVLLECGYRGVHLAEFSKFPNVLQQRIMPHINSTSLCSSLFRVKKFISLAMVCYQIKPRDKAYDAEINGKYHLNNIKIYQFFTLKRIISRYNLTLAVSQNPARVSMLFSTSIIASTGSTNYWSWINYIKYDVDSLPYPYDIDVFDGLTELKCQRKCISDTSLKERKLISAFGEATYTSLRHETLDESVSQASMNIRVNCYKICRQHESDGDKTSSYFQTSHDGPYEDEESKSENGTNGLWFRLSDYLVPHTYLHPSLRLLDLVLYIGTIYSIWFGLSALQTVSCVFSPRSYSSQCFLPRLSIVRRLYAHDIACRRKSHK